MPRPPAVLVQGWVEPVVAPFSPRHIIAQQLLALALLEHTLGLRTLAGVVERAGPARDGRVGRA